MHGTTMVFLVVVPILAGFGELPRAADDRRARHGVPAAERALVLAVPASAAIVLYAELLRRRAAPRDAGWTIVPAALGRLYSPATARTYWILACTSCTLASLAGAINFIVTIHNMRAPGMTWMRMPLFVWSIDIYACAARHRRCRRSRPG